MGDGRSLSIVLDDGRSWTLTARNGTIGVCSGSADGVLVLATDAEAWNDFVTERWSLPGLVFRGRVALDRGTFDHAMAWEPALQALYADRPIWSPAHPIAVDPTRSFTLDDDPAAMATHLAAAGFLHVRSVFAPDEIAEMAADVDRQRRAARPDDARSWWAVDEAGNEVCCRVTYLNHRSERFAALAHDTRLRRLAEVAGDDLVPTPDHGDGVSAVIKCASVVEGLSDLPWHRDCGMGGHPVMCPGLNVGVQIDPASEAAGRLLFLAGSNGFAGPSPADESIPQVVAVDTEAGDVTVHFGHTLHVAPPPTGTDGLRRTVYVGFHRREYTEVIPEGQGYNDVLFAHGDGRVRPPQDRLDDR